MQSFLKYLFTNLFQVDLLQGAEKAEESDEKVLQRVQVQVPSMKPTPTVALVTPSNHPSLFRRLGPIGESVRERFQTFSKVSCFCLPGT